MDEPERTDGVSEAKEPAIRTMRSDASELLKTTKPSLISLAARQADSGQQPLYETASRSSLARLVFIGGIAVLILGGAAIAFYTTYRHPPAPQKLAPSTPPPYVFFESTSDVAIDQSPQELRSVLADAGRASGQNGSLSRLVIRTRTSDGGNPVIEAGNFFSLLGVTLPQGFAESVASPPQFFIYQQGATPRFGVILDTKDAARIQQDLLNWEPSLQHDLGAFFLGTTTRISLAPYRDMTYRNIDFRYLTLDQATDIGLGYLYFPAKHRIIISTSEGALHEVINRLFVSP